MELFFARTGLVSGWPCSLADPELAGEVTLLAVLSSESAQCAAAAPVLAQLHARHAERGLAILGLAFDSTGDFVRDSERVRAFAQRHALEFPFFVRGKSDTDSATRALGWLEPVRAFPTFILVGRDRKVRAVLAGDTSSDSDLRAKLEASVQGLLGEPRDEGAQLWALLRATEWAIRSNRMHEFPGDRVVFSEVDGVRRASVVQDIEDGGRPIEVRGACLSGLGTWNYDAEAGVLLYPLKFGTRMFPAGGSATPLLARSAYTDEAGWVRALVDPDPVVRREALFALGDLRRRDGNLGEALPLLEDPVLAVRVAAAWALGEAREEGAFEALARLVDHPHPPLRCAALSALVKVHRNAEDLMPFLGAIEDDSDPLAKWALLSEMLD